MIRGREEPLMIRGREEPLMIRGREEPLMIRGREEPLIWMDEGEGCSDRRYLQRYKCM
jgi:hypothetical protein